MNPGHKVLIGVGHRDRGDDAVGPIVADLVKSATDAVVTIVREGDLAVLPLLWTEADDVVIVDACRTPGPLGEVRLIDPDDLAASIGMSTHGVNVADAIQLARRLGRMPQRLRVLGVVGSSFDHGPMSSSVRHRLPRIVDDVLAVLGERRN